MSFRRTADVRSVGYSELFSLSREDVLAAMKDYPDAQEILQTLGRKRLMEVRCVNKKHLKAQSDKEFAMNQHNNQHHHNHQQHQHVSDNSSENSASKKIVDKIKSDVMGIKSVLKKSRTSRRSNESLEMQPLHTNTSPKILPKGMLKRMSRVKSDDDKRPTFDSGEIDGSHHLHSSSAGAIAHSEAKDKTPSPIGAGLPLLQRLRLLKEKQVRVFRDFFRIIVYSIHSFLLLLLEMEVRSFFTLLKVNVSFIGSVLLENFQFFCWFPVNLIEESFWGVFCGFVMLDIVGICYLEVHYVQLVWYFCRVSQTLF